MLRDIWVVLLILGGLIVGATLGAIYHQTASAMLSKTIAARDAEIDRLNSALAAKQEQSAQAATSQKTLQHELDVLQLQLAEQTAIVARQRDLIAALEAERRSEPAAETERDSPEPGPPSDKEEGLVRGGKFVYHRVKLQPRDNELEIAGEIENRTKYRFGSVVFHIELFDERNRSLGKVAITIDNFLPGTIKPFKEFGLTGQPALQSAVSKFRITAALLNKQAE